MSLVGSVATDEGRAFPEWGVRSIIPRTQLPDRRVYARCDIRDLMRQVRCPVLPARGWADRVVPEHMVESTREARTTEQVELLPLPGLRHLPHLENQIRVAKAMQELLRGRSLMREQTN
jgi:pimeloyl-ACP methyl ester carboxylesterase